LGKHKQRLFESSQTQECNRAFVLTPVGVHVQVRQVDMIDGTRYFVDELINSSSATLKLGFLPALNILTPGSVGTTARDGSGVNIVRQFERVIRKRFTRVKSYWVGKEALAMLRSGARLTVGEKATPEYDLVAEKTDA